MKGMEGRSVRSLNGLDMYADMMCCFFLCRCMTPDTMQGPGEAQTQKSKSRFPPPSPVQSGRCVMHENRLWLEAQDHRYR